MHKRPVRPVSGGPGRRLLAGAQERGLEPGRHEAIQAARVRQDTPEWQALYGVRAGIEGCLSQGAGAGRGAGGNTDLAPGPPHGRLN